MKRGSDGLSFAHLLGKPDTPLRYTEVLRKDIYIVSLCIVSLCVPVNFLSAIFVKIFGLSGTFITTQIAHAMALAAVAWIAISEFTMCDSSTTWFRNKQICHARQQR